jgi:DNA-binding NarL/FixJ family response regulator
MAAKITNFKIKVAIAEDCRYTADRLSEDLKNVDGITITSISANGKILLKEVRKTPPDMVFMDVRMEIMDGIEATREIKKINPNIKVIAWSVLPDFHNRIKMFEAGACAFLDKDADFKEIQKCIKEVHKNGCFFNQYLNQEMFDSIVEGTKDTVYLVDGILLSNDEIRMIVYIADDMSAADMTGKFNLNIKSIERHRSALYSKTGTTGVASMTKYGVKHGIVKL